MSLMGVDRNNSAITNLIIKQEKQLFLRKDPIHVLTDLIDDEFMEIGSSAQLHDKAEVIRWFKKAESLDIQGIHFKAKFLSGDVILLTYISVTREQDLDKTKQALRSSIWRNVEGSWRMVFHQGTPIN